MQKSMSVETKQDELPLVWKPSWQLKCIFAVVGLLNFVAALDATSVSVSLPVYCHSCSPPQIRVESLLTSLVLFLD